MKTLLFILITLFISICSAQDKKKISKVQLDKWTSKSLSRNSKVTTSPTGQINLDTRGSFMSVTLARINDKGKIETFCTSSEKDAKNFLKGKDLMEIEERQK